MPKTSIKAAVRAAVRDDAKLRASLLPDGTQTVGATLDSFVNFAHKLGINADNPLSTATYGFNPITRNHTLLEWIHRGSWLGGVAIDVVADDMTRMGCEFTTEVKPEDQEKMDHCISSMGVWSQINEVIKWGRLYGGAIGVVLIDGQDLRTPLRLETVGKDAFKGLLVLDRWMCDPSIEDLVTEYGPQLGLPKYYRIGANAPALRGKAVHYSRVAFRHEGIRLPYQQRLAENLWGESVLERLYDRMVAYDSASTGAAQLVYKAYLRTLKIKGMREVVASGGPALDGLVKYTELMRRFQGIEGITLIDGDDEFEAQTHGAFSGLDSVLSQFAMQLSGALQIPLTRLFGQSPGGLGSSGDNEMRQYYDTIKQQQEAALHEGATLIHKLVAASLGIKLDDNFAIGFPSLWQLTETDKATIAKTNTETVTSAQEAGLISDQVALRELRQSSRITGVFTNITTELIDAADEEIADPMNEAMMGAGVDPSTGESFLPQPPEPSKSSGGSGNVKPIKREKTNAGSQGQAAPVASGKARRKVV